MLSFKSRSYLEEPFYPGKQTELGCSKHCSLNKVVSRGFVSLTKLLVRGFVRLTKLLVEDSLSLIKLTKSVWSNIFC